MWMTTREMLANVSHFKLVSEILFNASILFLKIVFYIGKNNPIVGKP